jgi:hypothetical protein
MGLPFHSTGCVNRGKECWNESHTINSSACAGAKERPAGVNRRVFSGQHIIRRSGPVEPASRSGYARGNGQCSNRRHRSSRHCRRRDSIRHSSRRIQRRTLQTHVGEIRHRGSLLHLNQRRGNQRCYGTTTAAVEASTTTKSTAMEATSAAHAASVSTAAAATSVTATTTAATSECRSWLNQADRCQCAQGYNRFSHYAFPSLGRGRSQGIQHFRSGIIRRSKSARSKLTVSIGKPHRSSSRRTQT